jgi:transcription antitermination factor NusG
MLQELTTDRQNFPLNWFAVSVRTRAENSVAKMLNTKGFEEFVPSYKETHQWSDRRKQVEKPLFTRYVFCRFDHRFRLPILTTPGVLSIVGTPAGPTAIEQREIDALRLVSKAGVECQPWPFLQPGHKVRVRRGPLSGIEGVLVRSKKDCRLVLSVTLLQRAVAIEVDSASVEYVANQ